MAQPRMLRTSISKAGSAMPNAARTMAEQAAGV